MIKKVNPKLWLLGTVILLFLSACSLPSPYNIYVTTTGNDGNDCRSTAHACLTIAAAISKAVPRSQIVIGAGTFPTGVVVNKFLDFVGAGQTQTTLSWASTTAPGISIADAVHASFSNLTIRGGSNGIELDGVNIATLLTATNVTITGATYGILNQTGSAIQLSHVSILNNVWGILTIGGTMNVSNSVFSGNSISAINNVSNTTLDHVTIDQNGRGVSTTPAPGAALSNQTDGALSGSLNIVSGTITNNHEIGIVNTGGPVRMNSSLVSNNDGVGIGNIGTFNIDTSVVSSNGGVGISSEAGSPHADVEITRTAIYNNNANGVYFGSGTASLTNSTVTGNHGIGVVNGIATVTLTNDTLAFNLGNGLYYGESSSTLVQNSIIALNAAPNCHTITGVLYQDTTSLACNDALTRTALKLGSLTAAAGTFVLPLQTGSPAIDHAGDACPAVDQRGYARPHGRACDIGAYEFGASLALVADTPAAETPSLAVLQIATATPSATVPVLQIVTDTPTAQLAAVVIPTLNAFCRKGPGTLYDQVMVLQKGTAYNVTGRDSLNSWWQIQTQGSNACWVGDANVSKQGPVEQAVIVQGAPLPGTPGNFVSSFVCNLKSKTLGVSFNWAGEAGVSGYRIYQNGSLLTTVAGNLTTYHEAAPLGVDLVYELEAFNANGVAPRSSTNVPACK